MIIGDTNVGERPVILAPMDEVTNPPFRAFCETYGADWLYSEFVSADALVRSVRKAERKLTISGSGRPVTIQIYGRGVEAMVEAARIVEASGANFIDLNFGCPVKRVAGKGAGAGLLRDIPLMEEITRQVARAVNLPVTAKTRLGWDDEHVIIDEIAERLQDAGARAIAIHGRTRAQMYKGEADWEPIARVKLNPRVRVPIIGNGDIDSPARALEAFERYGVDGVMIGRAAIGRPWIFRQVKVFLQTGEILPDPPLAEQVEVIKAQVSRSVEWLDETRGILHARRHMACMFKGLPNFRETRVEMLRAPTLERLWEVFERIKERGEGIEIKGERDEGRGNG